MNREIAFYYPNPMWYSGDWVKSLILFFDGIALLVPEYMKHQPEYADPAIVAGLKQHDLLHVIEPEVAVNKEATQRLAAALTDIIASGALDNLAQESTAFHELSISRLGYMGDYELAQMVFEELKKRRLARESEDKVSIPMHPKVRSLVLVLLAQILRPYGRELNAELSPATDRPQLVSALSELFTATTAPSMGEIVAFDLDTVGVDLGPVPMDEVLSFRAENFEAHRNYCLSARKFSQELSRMPEHERAAAFEIRQRKLNELAGDLRKRARKAWKKPASFALSLTGAAISFAAGHPLAAIISASSALLGYQSPQKTDTGVYSYLFKAHERFV